MRTLASISRWYCQVLTGSYLDKAHLCKATGRSIRSKQDSHNRPTFQIFQCKIPRFRGYRRQADNVTPLH